MRAKLKYFIIINGLTFIGLDQVAFVSSCRAWACGQFYLMDISMVLAPFLEPEPGFVPPLHGLHLFLVWARQFVFFHIWSSSNKTGEGSTQWKILDLLLMAQTSGALNVNRL